MKISKNTLNLLASFSNFNPSIFIKKGNVITTTNVGKENNRVVPIKSVLVRAEVEEDFPNDFSIFDLKQFLQVVSTFDDDPNFEFGEHNVIISENNHSIKYAYCEPSCVLTPNSDSLNVDEPFAKFILDSKTLSKIKKMSNVMKHDDFLVKSLSTSKIDIVLTTIDGGVEDNSNDYTISIENDEDGEERVIDLKFSMKSINAVANDDYSVKICNHNGRDILLFEALGDSKIVYYIAPKR